MGLQTNPSLIKIPSIVKAELLYGAYKSSKKTETIHFLNLFLEPFEIIPFDDECTSYFATIRSNLEFKGKPIGPYDTLIASIVLAHNGILVTKNTNEFERVNGLGLEDWTLEK